MIQVTAMDHIVLRVTDVERSVAFYRDVLGLGVERLQEWRAGRIGFPSVRVSTDTLIDIVRADSPASGRPVGLDHLCLTIATDDFAPVLAHLAAHGVMPSVGPARRWGAHGNGASIYISDPDGIEIELRTYAAPALAALSAAAST
jgi:catechol 2,3-dioxygenase-like lactoylglutathione lyase family enzyme